MSRPEPAEFFRKSFEEVLAMGGVNPKGGPKPPPKPPVHPPVHPPVKPVVPKKPANLTWLWMVLAAVGGAAASFVVSRLLG